MILLILILLTMPAFADEPEIIDFDPTVFMQLNLSNTIPITDHSSSKRWMIIWTKNEQITIECKDMIESYTHSMLCNDVGKIKRNKFKGGKYED